MKTNITINKWSSAGIFIWIVATVAIALLPVESAMAAAQAIGSVAANITKSMGDLAKLVTAGSYVAGFGFAVGAILKFKAHKDNPTQIPVGTPIALIFIAAALIFLPTIFGVAGKTMFSSGASVGGVSGVSSFAT